ncbi:MAG TPA: glycosyltransferase family 4 protein [Anaerolineaceae bacterium]|nr:glycosyltransferase family 4 protein [Anaerolineaceae bacterium]
MRILTISAFYPPYTYGGYEIRVGDIMNGLSARGHEICVLTTKPDHSLKAASKSFACPVIRRLHGPSRKLRFADRLTTRRLTRWLGIALVFLREVRQDIQDTALIEGQIRDFQPDLLYLGHIMPLTRVLMPYLARQALPLVADEGAKGLISIWEDRGLWQRFQTEFPQKTGFLHWVKQAFNWLVLYLSHGRIQQEWAFPANIQAFFNSNLNLNNALSEGVPLARTQVIHSGIDITQFSLKREKKFGNPLTILVPGRIEENKGQLDAVRVGAALKAMGIPFELTLVGERWNQKYAEKVDAEILALGLKSQVRTLPMLSRGELVRLYHQADITFFPSKHRSGFSRIPLEAMACGSLLITYGNEGSDEIVRDGENGLILAPEDSQAAAEEFARLLNQSDRVGQIIRMARQTVEDSYSMGGYLSRIEEFLLQALQFCPEPPAPAPKTLPDN